MKFTFIRARSENSTHFVYGRSWIHNSPKEGKQRQVYTDGATRIWGFRLFGGSR
jgi:hypothetical protein